MKSRAKKRIHFLQSPVIYSLKMCVEFCFTARKHRLVAEKVQYTCTYSYFESSIKWQVHVAPQSSLPHQEEGRLAVIQDLWAVTIGPAYEKEMKEATFVRQSKEWGHMYTGKGDGVKYAFNHLNPVPKLMSCSCPALSTSLFSVKCSEECDEERQGVAEGEGLDCNRERSMGRKLRTWVRWQCRTVSVVKRMLLTISTSPVVRPM